MKKFFVCGMLLFTLPVLLAGCMQSKRLSERAIVQGVGVDYEGQNYVLLLQIFEPKGSGTSAAADGEKNSRLTRGEGKTMEEAAQDAAQKEARSIFYGQNKVLILGEAAAQKGLLPITRFLSTKGDIRPNLDVVTAAGKAEEILSAKPASGLLPALSIEAMLHDGEERGVLLRGRMMQVVGALQNQKQDAQTPVVTKKIAPNGAEVLEITGVALYRQGQLVGTVAGRAANGMLWVKNKACASQRMIQDERLGRVALHMVHAKTKVHAVLKGEVPHFMVECHVKCRMQEAPVPDENGKLQHHIRLLQEQAEQVIQAEIEDAFLESVVLHQCDVLELSNRLEKDQPKWCAQNKSRYRMYLPQFTWEVHVRVQLTRYAAVG